MKNIWSVWWKNWNWQIRFLGHKKSKRKISGRWMEKQNNFHPSLFLTEKVYHHYAFSIKILFLYIKREYWDRWNSQDLYDRYPGWCIFWRSAIYAAFISEKRYSLIGTGWVLCRRNKIGTLQKMGDCRLAAPGECIFCVVSIRLHVISFSETIVIFG